MNYYNSTGVATLRRVLQLARTSPEPIGSRHVQDLIGCGQSCASVYLRRLVELGCLRQLPARPHNALQFEPGAADVPDALEKPEPPPKVSKPGEDPVIGTQRVIVTRATQIGVRRDSLVAALFGVAGVV